MWDRLLAFGSVAVNQSPPVATAILEKPVQFVRGVGATRAAALERMGIATLEDLLYLQPRRFVDLRDFTAIAELDAERPHVVRGRLEHFRSFTTRNGVPGLNATVVDPTGMLSVSWFHRADLLGRLRLGDDYDLTGKVRVSGGRWLMTNPRVDAVALPADGLFEAVADAPAGDALEPVYPATEGVTSDQIRRAVRAGLEDLRRHATEDDELAPAELRRRRSLLDLSDALQRLHFPADHEQHRRGRRRLIYDEFLVLQTALALRRAGLKRGRSVPLHTTAEIDRRVRRLFPFDFTGAQDEAIAEIARDLMSPQPMYRLLQGDVGSGKTVVALYAMLVAVANGRQAVLMAPTEVLARQHFATVDGQLADSRVRRRLLVGSLSAVEKTAVRAELAAGEIDLVVGTHALVQDSVDFARLGCAVIDEQHKFGVAQRGHFQRLTPVPHQLVMTATPIPRSLSMTWFGDLDLTLLRDKPAGRAPVDTQVLAAAEADAAYRHLEEAVRRGGQAMVVCARISAAETDEEGEEGEEREDDAEDGGAADEGLTAAAKEPLRSVEEVHAELTAGRTADLSVALVHGRLDEAEKQATLARFRRGDVAVLVSTVVIEVGIDVPEANVIVIENAERFGLSQLHQIRGRVGRGDLPGTCLLIDRSGGSATQRLRELAATSDGFRIAELDAQVRGTGQMVGRRQSGNFPLRIGSLLADQKLLAAARKDAQRIVDANPSLAAPCWRRLRERVVRDYGKRFELALIG